MRRTIPLTPIGFVLLGVCLSGSVGAGESGPYGPPAQPTQKQPTSPARPPAPSVIYGVCWGEDAKSRYLSAVFAGEAPGDAADVSMRQGMAGVWKQAFGRYLIKEHNFQSAAQCGAFATRAEAEAYFRQVGPCPRGPGRCVETGWAYTAPAKGPEASLPPASNYAFCLTPASSKREIYFSTVQPKAESLGPGQFESSFVAYLASKYGYKTSATCWDSRAAMYIRDQAAQITRARQSKIDDYRSAGYTVIETDWAFTSATSATSPTPPPVASTRPAPIGLASPAQTVPAAAVAAAPQKVTHAVCWADFDPRTRYYSAVFDGMGSDYADWMPAFKTFLEQKYQYTGQVRCNKQPSQAEAQKYWDNMVGLARTTSLGDGSKAKIIETGWSYPQ